MERLKADYKNFTFKKMFTKEFSHVWYLFVIATHFLSYILTEKLINPDNCYVVHSRLDDIIPFCEYFIVPYILWYVLLFFTGIYFMFYDVNSFKKFMNFLIISNGKTVRARSMVIESSRGVSGAVLSTLPPR